jgi:hypothetical protein
VKLQKAFSKPREFRKSSKNIFFTITEFLFFGNCPNYHCQRPIEMSHQAAVVFGPGREKALM